MALLLTLLVVAILMVVVLEFNYMMRVHATLSGNLLDDFKAQTAAETGEEMAVALLLDDLVADTSRGEMADSLDEAWASEIDLETPSSATVATVSDEMAKLNVNRLVNRSSEGRGVEEVNGTMAENFRRLFERLEIDPDLVDTIVDWEDYDDEERAFGAEQSYYDTLAQPIRCKNGPLDSVAELLNVKGFDEAILYGTEDKPGLAQFITVCGHEEGLININTASEEVIGAVLNSESLASAIVDSREGGAFANAEDIVTRFPDVNIAGKFATSSSYFSVRSSARVPSAESPTREVTIQALLKRNLAEQTVEEDQTGIDVLSWKIER